MGGIYNGTWLVSVDDYDSKNLSNVNQSVTQEGSWVGARTRFWSFLVSPKNNQGSAYKINESELEIRLRSTTIDGLHRFVLYFGPLNTKQFSVAEPELRKLMYAALWDWLRQLCFFIEWVFIWLLNLSGNSGLAIILLACVLKILIYPINQIAEKWQDDVNVIHSMLQPKIDEIKSSFSGEEANRRIMKMYKNKNISPFYSIKSLFGFLIQIPIFIAVFDVLGESIYLLGEPFAFINDLSKPDQWAMLPLFIPFFGASINLLPFCMMIISMLSAYLYTDKNLNKDLLSNQKRKLYLMSFLFFVLLFTFPAGMVLYWTTSNFLQLMQMQIKKALQ
jgi:YidC/Oxa1 family membrane protein insertase